MENEQDYAKRNGSEVDNRVHAPPNAVSGNNEGIVSSKWQRLDLDLACALDSQRASLCGEDQLCLWESHTDPFLWTGEPSTGN